MRIRSLVLGAGLPLLVMSCKPSGLVQGAECKVSDTAAGRCLNLLPAGWDKWEGTELRALELSMDDVAKFLQLTRVEQRREGGACDDRSNRQVVTYEAPQDLQRMPSTGTGQRDLVVAIFTSKKAGNGCPDKRYGIAPDPKNKKRLYQFITVRTEAVMGHPTGKFKIGTYRAWALTKNQGNVYTLDSLGGGDYVSCNHDKVYQPAALGFYGCDGLDSLTTSGARAARSIYGDGSVVSISWNVANLMRRDRSGAWGVLAFLRSFSFEELPAWGRCGNMGCCAAE